MKKIITVDGGKGGVGKSIVASAVLDVLYKRGCEKGILVDSDPSNPDVGKAYSEAPWLLGCEFYNTDTKDGFLSLIDCVQESQADYTIINCPARAEGWLKYGALLIENLAELNAEFATLWVLGRQRDSVESLKIYHDLLPTVVIHPVINTYWGEKNCFQIWNDSNMRQIVLSNGGKEILFPAVADRVTDQARITRRRWDEEDNIPLSIKLESRRFRIAAHAALDPIL